MRTQIVRERFPHPADDTGNVAINNASVFLDLGAGSGIGLVMNPVEPYAILLMDENRNNVDVCKCIIDQACSGSPVSARTTDVFDLNATDFLGATHFSSYFGHPPLEAATRGETEKEVDRDLQATNFLKLVLGNTTTIEYNCTKYTAGYIQGLCENDQELKTIMDQYITVEIIGLPQRETSRRVYMYIRKEMPYTIRNPLQVPPGNCGSKPVGLVEEMTKEARLRRENGLFEFMIEAPVSDAWTAADTVKFDNVTYNAYPMRGLSAKRKFQLVPGDILDVDGVECRFVGTLHSTVGNVIKIVLLPGESNNGVLIVATPAELTVPDPENRQNGGTDGFQVAWTTTFEGEQTRRSSQRRKPMPKEEVNETKKPKKPPKNPKKPKEPKEPKKSKKLKKPKNSKKISTPTAVKPKKTKAETAICNCDKCGGREVSKSTLRRHQEKQNQVKPVHDQAKPLLKEFNSRLNALIQERHENVQKDWDKKEEKMRKEYVKREEKMQKDCDDLKKQVEDAKQEKMLKTMRESIRAEIVTELGVDMPAKELEATAKETDRQLSVANAKVKKRKKMIQKLQENREEEARQAKKQRKESRRLHKQKKRELKAAAEEAQRASVADEAASWKQKLLDQEKATEGRIRTMKQHESQMAALMSEKMEAEQRAKNNERFAEKIMKKITKRKKSEEGEIARLQEEKQAAVQKYKRMKKREKNKKQQSPPDDRARSHRSPSRDQGQSPSGMRDFRPSSPRSPVRHRSHSPAHRRSFNSPARGRRERERTEAIYAEIIGSQLQRSGRRSYSPAHRRSSYTPAHRRSSYTPAHRRSFSPAHGRRERREANYSEISRSHRSGRRTSYSPARRSSSLCSEQSSRDRSI